jgi:hypothetical protein
MTEGNPSGIRRLVAQSHSVLSCTLILMFLSAWYLPQQTRNTAQPTLIGMNELTGQIQ